MIFVGKSLVPSQEVYLYSDLSACYKYIQISEQYANLEETSAFTVILSFF